jgi:hypothetical protein
VKIGIAIAAVLLLGGCDSVEESQPYNMASAKNSYDSTCAVCHGKNGVAEHALAKPAIRLVEMNASHWPDNYSARAFVSYMKLEHEPSLIVSPGLLRYTKEHFSD